jgi:hypothetical protein
MSFDYPCYIVFDVEIIDFLDDRTNVVAYDDDNVLVPKYDDR